MTTMPPADERLEKLHRMVETDPGDAFCLYGLGQEYARRGRHDDSIGWYDRCLAADPDHCYAYFHKARVLEECGRVPEAIETLRLGLARAKAVADAHAAREIAGYLDQLT